MSLASFFGMAVPRPQREDVDTFLARMQLKLQHTPDIARLSRREKQLVFVYDDLMKGHYSHDDLIKPHGKFQATAFTEVPYGLWKKKLGPVSFPVALEQGYYGAPRLAVKGELYSIDTPQLLALDRAKENMHKYVRTRVHIQIPYRAYVFLKERIEVHGAAGTEPTFMSEGWTEMQIGTVSAWMYVGVPDYWCPQLDAGYLFSPVRRFFNTKQAREYYYFNILEYDE